MIGAVTVKLSLMLLPYYCKGINLLEELTGKMCLFFILFQMWLTMADVTFAFGLSLFLLLLVEAPFRNIEKTVLGKHR